MIKNLETRKKIAKLVYCRYGNNLTIEEKKELENEVGAAMEGYELAIEEAVKLLENNFNMPNDFSQIFREHLGQL